LTSDGRFLLYSQQNEKTKEETSSIIIINHHHHHHQQQQKQQKQRQQTKAFVGKSTMKFKSEIDPRPTDLRESISCDACATPKPSSRCKTCHMTFYCHEACASNHWQVHKAYCKSSDDILQQSQLVLKDWSPVDALETSSASCDMCEAGASINRPLYHYKAKGCEVKCCDSLYCMECMNHFQTFSSSLLISLSKVEAEKCPICRVGKDPSEANYKFHQVALWTARAASHSLQKQQTNKFASKALDYVESLLDEDSKNQSAKVMQGRVLGLLGEYQFGLVLLRESLFNLQTTIPHQTSVDDLMKKVQQSMLHGDVKQAEAYLEDVQKVRNQKFALLVQPSDLIDLYLCIAELELKSTEYNTCQQTLEQNVLKEEKLLAPDQRMQAYLQLAQCFYETKHYDKAIAVGNLAIDMNRHYPQVYKYTIMALYQKGELKEAKKIASQAVLYETPWDAQNQHRVQNMYNELFANE
jgi:tetratricopeptide (TPR) repeat protein